MSLRWSSYVAPTPPKRGAQKRKHCHFSLKLHFAWRKSAVKFLSVKTVGEKVYSLAKLSMQIRLMWTTHSTWNFGSNWSDGAKSPIFDLFSLVYSASAVTSGEKSSINITTNSKSITRAFQWAQENIVRCPYRPKGGGQKSKVSKIWTISRDNSETVRDKMSVTINH